MSCLAVLAMACAPKEPVKYLALAFDDGPNLTTETKMLDVLKKHKVPATFFVIGNNITDESSANMKRAVRQGCEIGNHSWSHPMMSQMDEGQVKEEIEATSALIEKITGKRPKFFRPPYINVKPEMYDWIDLTFICGVGCEDWVPEVSAEERTRRILEAAADGVIYLLHDMTGNVNTVEALKTVIPELKKRGFEFLTVPQLFEQCGVTPVRGRIYSNVFQTA